MASLLDLLTGGQGQGILGNNPFQQQQQQPQPQPQPQQGGGFGNYVNNNPLTLLALGAGIAKGGIGGMGEALPAAQFEQGQQRTLQSQKTLYDAIKQAGGTEAQARAGALNPEAFKAFAPDLFGAPKVVNVGTDILGRPQMKLQQGSKFSEIPSTGGGTSGGGFKGVDETKPIYEQLPKPQQDVVDSMLAGRMPVPSSFALKTPYWNTLLTAANEKAREQGGTFDATTWGQRNVAAKDLAPQGRSGKVVNALDTVQGHIGDKLIPAIDKLEATGWAPNVPIMNQVQNLITGAAPGLNVERAKALTSFNNARKAVVDEMGSAYKAGHLTDAEVKDWSALIMNADSTIKLRQATADFVDLLNTKRQTTIGQYAGLNVPFKGANEAENARITKLAHDKNAGTTETATPGQPAAASPPTVAPPGTLPPPAQRGVGRIYQTPKGPMIWRGNGWEAATNANSL